MENRYVNQCSYGDGLKYNHVVRIPFFVNLFSRTSSTYITVGLESCCS